MIFKIVKTVHDDGRVNHGVSLFYDDESEKQDAVIISGVSYVAASKLYNDLNDALAKAGMVKQDLNKAANESAGFEHLHSRVDLTGNDKSGSLSSEQVFGFMNDKNEQLLILVTQFSVANKAFEKEVKSWKIAFMFVLFLNIFVYTLLPIVHRAGFV